MRGMLRCVSCLLLAVLAVLLTDVCSAEQGKIFYSRGYNMPHLACSTIRFDG